MESVLDRIPTEHDIQRMFLELENRRTRLRKYLYTQDISKLREIQAEYKLQPTKDEIIEVILGAGAKVVGRIHDDFGLND